MVRNYKWNIELEKVTDIAKNTIIEILKENNEIQFNKLIETLNLRTKHLRLKNNSKNQLMTNFLKSNYKGSLNFIQKMDNVLLTKYENNIIVSYNDKGKLFKDFDGWCFVNSEKIES